MKPVKFGKDAAIELEEAAAWYESEQAGLGNSFVASVEAAVQLLREPNPPLIKVAGEAGLLGAKKLILHRFPFSVIIYETTSCFHIVAIAHHSRKPGYWQGRQAK